MAASAISDETFAAPEPATHIRRMRSRVRGVYPSPSRRHIEAGRGQSSFGRGCTGSKGRTQMLRNCTGSPWSCSRTGRASGWAVYDGGAW